MSETGAKPREARRLQPLQSIVDHVGHTPLVRISRCLPPLSRVEVWAKLEWFNPGGSVKDRAARSMIDDALARGLVSRERPLIDSTSGNTGIAYSLVGAALGQPVALVMPENVSTARKRITRAYGAEQLFTDPLEQSDGALLHVRELVRAQPERYFYPDQYSNEENPNAHERTTAREIFEQTGGRVTHFVAGLGTTGTMMGTSRGLKKLKGSVRCFALEPAEELHGLEGLKHLKSSIVPAIFEPAVCDGRLAVSTDDGWSWAEKLAREEGLLAGHSSGAALAGALEVARALEVAGQAGVVVTVFPDRADRYYEPPPTPQRRPAAW